MVNSENKILISVSSRVSHQQGVVLVVSLVFLIALTAVAAALMQNTTSDMIMSGASQEKVVATQEAVSAIDEIIFNYIIITSIIIHTQIIRNWITNCKLKIKSVISLK